MSGGVDSSVAAALLASAGHRVFGIMLRLWAEPGAVGANRCCTTDAIEDARSVADRLGIAFQVIDMAARFREAVVEPFVHAVEHGGTPNPCFDCNRRVRFGSLLDSALALGADALATGHYARVLAGPGGGLRLLRGLDRAKDQSYMLHRLDQAMLAKARFPLGEMTKPEVRQIAERMGLPVAGRRDSVDLCWVGDGGVEGFIGRYAAGRALEPGEIVDQTGARLGTHRGLARYTLGQRHGLGVAVGRPVYVVGFDRERNLLIVGDAAALFNRAVSVRGMHWIAGEQSALPLRAQGQIRYGSKPAPCTVRAMAGMPARCAEVEFVFDEPQRAPTPG